MSNFVKGLQTKGRCDIPWYRMEDEMNWYEAILAFINGIIEGTQDVNDETDVPDNTLMFLE